MPCPKYHSATIDPRDPQTGGLAQCEKYNRYPMRAIPWGGEPICQQPEASPENCWLDFRSCRKADIARRVYAYSTLGETDLLGNPTIGVVTQDEAGRRYYCLHRNGVWVHDGDHDLPVPVPVTASGPIA
jgi:hypothetical protein